MFKKLDKLILKAFFWPFIATFFITLFVFMMQILWKYIDDLVGKGLDIVTLTEFLIYASATLVTLAMPISILLSSIMTFGKLGENFELVAIKSAGISLLRFMRPLFFMAVLFSGVAFLFANYIAPVANLKFAVIYHDIYQKSPAFDLKDGVFYNGFSGFSIKVGKKEKDKSTLQNVLIYEQSYGVQDNTIISEGGKMNVSDNKQYLEFKLINGHRYEEKGATYNTPSEFINLGFKEYTKLFDLSQLNLQKTSDSLFMNNNRMKNMRQLNKDLDSIVKIPDSLYKRSKQDLGNYVQYTRLPDSVTSIPLTAAPAKKETQKKTKDSTETKTVDDLIPEHSRLLIDERTANAINNAKNLLDVSVVEDKTKRSEITQLKIEWHKKLSLSVACLVLFFIGAPLGSIIRKGGLGMPIVVALIFFMIFYLLNIFGEKFSKDNIVDPVLGMWLPVIVLTPIGFFLTYKAMHDSQLFNKEFYYRTAKRIRKLFSSFGKKTEIEERNS
ncbi:MAG: LptF/LptG family permease [Ginsengibacter sp.]